jgi:hypothetical protein
MPIPRMIVGGLLVAMGVAVFLRLPGPHSVTWDVARVVIVGALCFVGTQVLLGKRIPGFRKRQRGSFS